MGETMYEFAIRNKKTENSGRRGIHLHPHLHLSQSLDPQILTTSMHLHIYIYTYWYLDSTYTNTRCQYGLIYGRNTEQNLLKAIEDSSPRSKQSYKVQVQMQINAFRRHGNMLQYCRKIQVTAAAAPYTFAPARHI
ncbi:hypothetical protein SAY87_012955 [Trapa incisa]|uniref:Uncharacterized protein n=1 Tax=Trapa incisa TaxID=236973 RepID=A0AAN7QCG4_9MYRT|nr:hypothetical protein SAY87_012955 [Trapa incisa]